MTGKRIAILVGGSDLFSGMRGISKGTRIIENSIDPYFDEVHAVNYNYFLDAGRCLRWLTHFFKQHQEIEYLMLYGYSKGGDIVLKLCRKLNAVRKIDLLITVDIANGPWSHKIDRAVPGNVRKNINIFQSSPSFPLRSYGEAASSDKNVEIKNIDVSGTSRKGQKINHSNIELLYVDDVVHYIVSDITHENKQIKMSPFNQ